MKAYQSTSIQSHFCVDSRCIARAISQNNFVRFQQLLYQNTHNTLPRVSLRPQTAHKIENLRFYARFCGTMYPFCRGKSVQDVSILQGCSRAFFMQKITYRNVADMIPRAVQVNKGRREIRPFCYSQNISFSTFWITSNNAL